VWVDFSPTPTSYPPSADEYFCKFCLLYPWAYGGREDRLEGGGGKGEQRK
jgi:hypothetical protein